MKREKNQQIKLKIILLDELSKFLDSIYNIFSAEESVYIG
ncbi:uncharacterized protein METZ01_LOCUS20769 [marine metagenome]|jgi:hypothetical protein|uniref:Uncharacterized protein n=1 Tax=marine metagenome TaxID=408172 RepID=A0A381PLK4_9ZZZZ|tara:strand:- start:1542 stop:1661 length:120 start_codon:yes stop_codon:yes gene_type:complete